VFFYVAPSANEGSPLFPLGMPRYRSARQKRVVAPSLFCHSEPLFCHSEALAEEPPSHDQRGGCLAIARHDRKGLSPRAFFCHSEALAEEPLIVKEEISRYARNDKMSRRCLAIARHDRKGLSPRAFFCHSEALAEEPPSHDQRGGCLANARQDRKGLSPRALFLSPRAPFLSPRAQARGPSALACGVPRHFRASGRQKGERASE